MIIARAPLRISLGGGGTDLPAYSQRYGGCCLSAAIDKYVYVTINPRFGGGFRVCYADTEITETVEDIKHPLFRECLKASGISGGLELASMADAPANSGLGSSSSFTVACLAALQALKGGDIQANSLAHMACEVEIIRLKAPIGKQDQYIAAHGGVRDLTFARNGDVTVSQLQIKPSLLAALEDRLVAFYTGIKREANAVLDKQKAGLEDDIDVVSHMHQIKQMGREAKAMLEAGHLDEYGQLLHKHWEIKRGLVKGMTSGIIDEHYEQARKAGAIGGKLMGAGGGGFFLFYTRKRAHVVDAMTKRGLVNLPFKFETGGAKIVCKV